MLEKSFPVNFIKITQNFTKFTNFTKYKSSGVIYGSI